MNFLTSCMDQALYVLLEAPIRKNDKLRGPELTPYDWCVLWEMVFLQHRNFITERISFYDKTQK